MNTTAGVYPVIVREVTEKIIWVKAPDPESAIRALEDAYHEGSEPYYAPPDREPYDAYVEYVEHEGYVGVVPEEPDAIFEPLIDAVTEERETNDL